MLFDPANKEQYALFEKNILYPFLEDTYVDNDFGKFTSSSSSGIIWNVKSDRQKGAGETTTFGLYQYSDASEVYDDVSLSGKGDINRPISDSLTLGKTRFAVATEGKKLAEIQTKIDIDAQLREDLHTKSKLLQTRRIINQFAFCFDNATIRSGPNHKSYSYCIKGNYPISAFADYFLPKITAATIDTDENSISSDRLVIGNDQLGALQASIGESIVDAQIGSGDPTVADSGTMTVKHIEKLVRVANLGGRTPNSEQVIKPYRTMSHLNYDNRNFVLFVSPSCGSVLRQDPRWFDQTTRGLRETSSQPSIFYNTNYMGSIYNVDIIVVPEFEHMTVTNGEGHKIAYSALCGQSAIVSTMGMKPMFTVENNDHLEKHELGVTMIDAMKPLKFLAKNPANKANNVHLEKGIIHSFTRIN
jgi:hypothetical protein